MCCLWRYGKTKKCIGELYLVRYVVNYLKCKCGVLSEDWRSSCFCLEYTKPANMMLKILTLVTFVGMVGVNAAANILPINGLTTGALSDYYPNLFAPAGVTFSIWGLIYLLLAIYVGYQFLQKRSEKQELIKNINIFFVISSLANSAWIFAWHYRIIGLSVVFMLVILFSLIKISSLANKMKLSLKDKLFIKIPFGVYFGWITVATIANITVLLVSLGWKNYIFPDQIWMILILIIGTVIAAITTIKEKSLAYGLVPIWAYYGIYLKHTSPANFNYMYPDVIATTVMCILLLITVNVFLIIKKRGL